MFCFTSPRLLAHWWTLDAACRQQILLWPHDNMITGRACFSYSSPRGAIVCQIKAYLRER